MRPSLWPIAHLADGKLLVADPLISIAVNKMSHPTDVTSGAYVLDIASGSLSPLIRQSSNGEYGGPIAVALSPDGSELLVVWFDSALTHPYREAIGVKGRYVVSILEIDSIGEPIDARELPQVYGSATDPDLFDSVGFPVEWAENNTVLLTTQSDEGPGSVLVRLNRGWPLRAPFTAMSLMSNRRQNQGSPSNRPVQILETTSPYAGGLHAQLRRDH